MDSMMMSGGIMDIVIAREDALCRFEQINWKDYTRTDSFDISAADVALLVQIETLMTMSKKSKQPTAAADQLKSFLTQSGSNLGRALIKLLKNVTEPTVVRYALARIEELLPDGALLRGRVAYLVDKAEDDSKINSAPFLRLIRAGHGYTETAASQILAKMITAKPKKEDMEALVDWIVQCLSLGSNAEMLKDPARAASAVSAIGSLMILLRDSTARIVFASSGGLKLLSVLLANSAGRAQLSYEVSFCLWTLTYCDQAVELFGTSSALSALIKKIMTAPREKVIRVILAALRNLLGKHNGTYNEVMIESGLLKYLNQMKERKWSDDDISVELNMIRDVLIREFKVLTTMERYEKELQTSQLNWGLLHTDKFWQENYMAFESKNFATIKTLIELLESNDPVTVAVALYDLGDFVRFYPNGRMIVKRLGAKKSGLASHDK